MTEPPGCPLILGHLRFVLQPDLVCLGERSHAPGKNVFCCYRGTFYERQLGQGVDSIVQAVLVATDFRSCCSYLLPPAS